MFKFPKDSQALFAFNLFGNFHAFLEAVERLLALSDWRQSEYNVKWSWWRAEMKVIGYLELYMQPEMNSISSSHLQESGSWRWARKMRTNGQQTRLLITMWVSRMDFQNRCITLYSVKPFEKFKPSFGIGEDQVCKFCKDMTSSHWR